MYLGDNINDQLSSLVLLDVYNNFTNNEISSNMTDYMSLQSKLSNLSPYHFRDLLHTKSRREETCDHLIHVLGEDCISCELQLAGPEYESLQGFSALSQAVAEELFNCELSDKEASSQALSPEMIKVKKATTITIDNFMSPAHTLLQIQCLDQKGLIYDILRTSKDCNIQVISFLKPFLLYPVL